MAASISTPRAVSYRRAFDDDEPAAGASFSPRFMVDARLVVMSVPVVLSEDVQ